MLPNEKYEVGRYERLYVNGIAAIDYSLNLQFFF